MKSSGNKIRVLDPRGQPSGIFGRNLNPEDDMMAITDPAVQPTVSMAELEHLHMAPRLASLENKRIMLIDSGFAGSHDFLEEVQAWFKTHIPSVKTVRKRTPGAFVSERDKAFFEEVKANADGAVIGVAG